MIWDQLKQGSKDDPLMKKIVNELHVNYNSDETTVNKGQLMRIAKAILGGERLKWLERKGLLSGEILDEDFFRTIAIEPLSYPALKVMDNSIESAGTYYWRSRMILNEKKILKAAQSVGRLHLSLCNDKYMTGFLENPEIFVTTKKVLSFFKSAENFMNRARISFTKYAMPVKEELFRIIEIKETGNGFLKLKMDRIIDVEHNILDGTIGGNIIKQGDLLVRIGFPKIQRMDEVGFSDMMIYQLGDKLGKLNVTPGICGRASKEDTWNYKSAGGFHLGSPIIHLDSGKLVGMDIGNGEFMTIKNFEYDDS